MAKHGRRLVPREGKRQRQTGGKREGKEIQAGPISKSYLLGSEGGLKCEGYSQFEVCPGEQEEKGLSSPLGLLIAC